MDKGGAFHRVMAEATQEINPERAALLKGQSIYRKLIAFGCEPNKCRRFVDNQVATGQYTMKQVNIATITGYVSLEDWIK